MIAEEILKQEPDAIKVLFNKFHSAISFKPTVRAVSNECDAVEIDVRAVSIYGKGASNGF